MAIRAAAFKAKDNRFSSFFASTKKEKGMKSFVNDDGNEGDYEICENVEWTFNEIGEHIKTNTLVADEVIKACISNDIDEYQWKYW